jgi:hypothetical protein
MHTQAQGLQVDRCRLQEFHRKQNKRMRMMRMSVVVSLVPIKCSEVVINLSILE